MGSGQGGGGPAGAPVPALQSQISGMYRDAPARERWADRSNNRVVQEKSSVR